MFKITLGVVPATILVIAVALRLNIVIIIKQAFADASGGFQSSGQGAPSSDLSNIEHEVFGAIAKIKAHDSNTEQAALGTVAKQW